MTDLAALPPQPPLGTPETANYLLLGRLKHDCEHYLGHGNRNPTRLWALNEADQIAKMKELYAGLSVKPEWLTLADIASFEAQMVA